MRIFWPQQVRTKILNTTYKGHGGYRDRIVHLQSASLHGTAMRFIAQWFVKLMEKYNFLETAAFIVIAILGIKLTLSLYEHFYPESGFSKFLSSHTADIGISVLTVAIFFVPILTSLFFNFPKKQTKEE